MLKQNLTQDTEFAAKLAGLPSGIRLLSTFNNSPRHFGNTLQRWVETDKIVIGGRYYDGLQLATINADGSIKTDDEYLHNSNHFETQTARLSTTSNHDNILLGLDGRLHLFEIDVRNRRTVPFPNVDEESNKNFYESLLSAIGVPYTFTYYLEGRSVNNAEDSIHIGGKSRINVSFSKGPKVTSIDQSPNGENIAISLDDGGLLILNKQDLSFIKLIEPHIRRAESIVRWSPNGMYLIWACNQDFRCFRLKQEIKSASDFELTLRQETLVSSVSWLNSSNLIIAGEKNGQISFIDPETGYIKHRLEGHVGAVKSLTVSSDEKLLASQAITKKDGFLETLIWAIDNYTRIVSLPQRSRRIFQRARGSSIGFLEFHPTLPMLLSWSDCDGETLDIWKLDTEELLNSIDQEAIYYTNARIVLLGDSGVGKSGLGLVLSGKPFVATESTHSRKIWNLSVESVRIDPTKREIRETILWDLAGQPGYRLIHQLYLNEVNIAIIVFDAKSEIDPFAGVLYWDRALNQAMSGKYNEGSVVKLLVEARADRGMVGAGDSRVQELIDKCGFKDYIVTSAKEGKGIQSIKDKLFSLIDWNLLPKVTSNDLFQSLQNFLIDFKAHSHRTIVALGELYSLFEAQLPLNIQNDVYVEFSICIELVESRGLIRRLNFGNLVLLQPEILDAYASALINTVRNEPDGLGFISEDKVIGGHFDIPSDSKVSDREEEKLLLIAMIEDLIKHELTFKESALGGQFLVFPSQSARNNFPLTQIKGREYIIHFEGPIQNIYATLAVRLVHSGMFQLTESGRGGLVFSTIEGGRCGISLTDSGEGAGEITIFFEKHVSSISKSYFSQFILSHILKRAVMNSIYQEKLMACLDCDTDIPSEIIKKRLALGRTSLICPVCEREITIGPDQISENEKKSKLEKMENTADKIREDEIARVTIQGKMEARDFDVFLCHNSKDKVSVRRLYTKLIRRGILPWLDEKELQPGLPWQKLLEKEIGKIKAAAVIIGEDGIGPWQDEEIAAFIREFIKRGCPVIPIILDRNTQDAHPILYEITLISRCMRDRPYPPTPSPSAMEREALSSCSESLV